MRGKAITLCCLLVAAPWFSFSFHNPEVPFRVRGKFTLRTTPEDGLSLNTYPEAFMEMAKQIKALPEGKERALKLVEFGDKYTLGHGASMESLGSTPTKVPGCLAEVYVNVSLDEEDNVTVRGCADARVPGGLLALAAAALGGRPAAAALGAAAAAAGALGPAAGLGRASVTPSRLNGLRNVAATIGQLIQRELDRKAAGGGGAGQQQEAAAAAGGGHWAPPAGWAAAGGPGETAVLLSGGVDSSVALRLLQEQGHRPRAFYLKIWLEDELAHLGECPWEEDLAYARAVCDQAGVPLEVLSLQKEYWDKVVRYTIAEAEAGRTPNPDIMCNARIKFGMFYEYAGRRFRHVATGHYARSHTETNSKGEAVTRLLCSPDPVKDQTYFLSTLGQDQISKALFPVGEYTKSEIRELAEKFDLPTKMRKDSQGICFLGKLKFDDFLAHYLGENPGLVIDEESGEVVGEHKGLWYHTIGQRKGLGPSLFAGQVNRGPWYVIEKNMRENKLIVSNSAEKISSILRENVLVVQDFQWISGNIPEKLKTAKKMKLKVKLRHGPNTQSAWIQKVNGSNTAIFVELENNDSIAPGQFAAFYTDEDECLGAGPIGELTSNILDQVELGKNTHSVNTEEEEEGGISSTAEGESSSSLVEELFL